MCALSKVTGTTKSKINNQTQQVRDNCTETDLVATSKDKAFNVLDCSNTKATKFIKYD